MNKLINIAVVMIGGTVSIPSFSNGESFDGLTSSPFKPPKKDTFDMSNYDVKYSITI